MASEKDRARLRTRASLLARARNVTDEEAWREFVAEHSPVIAAWCRRTGLTQHDDVQVVVQRVLTKMLERMPDFVYDPNRSFRAGWWLGTESNRWNKPNRGQPDGANSVSIRRFQARYAGKWTIAWEYGL